MYKHKVQIILILSIFLFVSCASSSEADEEITSAKPPFNQLKRLKKLIYFIKNIKIWTRFAKAKEQLDYVLKMKPDEDFLPEYERSVIDAKKLLKEKF